MRRHRSNLRSTWLAGLVVAGSVLLSSEARAQSSSMFGDPARRAPLTLAGTSWGYIEVQPPRELRLHDLVTVIVDEKSQLISEGEVNQRMQSNINAVLMQWMKLENGDLKPDPFYDGTPGIQAILNAQRRGQSELEARDGLKFSIAAEVVDIRPNGNLVLEARKEIKNNEDVWNYSLTGIVRPQDILPNNSVLSEDLAELRINKYETGMVRDGYRRGWLLKLIDEYRPF
ncbi:MAG: flagellar basal body L-ring protein FlgH [Pirellulales bacterium]|nr:flagellar basal body L-ring protein FlgH [Pirellulales bacterium]